MQRTAVAFVLLIITGTVSAHQERIVRTDDCSQRNVRFDGEKAYVERQVINAGSRSLRLSVSHAPVAVRGGDDTAFSITVCKAAALEQDLAAIRVWMEGDELRATGPDERRWSVTYSIRAPRGGELDLRAENGPVSVRDFDGALVARMSNGPLSLENFSGTVDAKTSNGPVRIAGGSGTAKIEAANGPISVRLTGPQWRGGTLDASTRNGPLTVSVPRGYGSRVAIESNGRGPISCRAEGCEQFVAARYGQWSDVPRRIELGSGPEVIRLSTVNGPVTIKDE